ncbi:DUF4097 domain-containing protein [Candidatus Dependentiae bacterium]
MKKFFTFFTFTAILSIITFFTPIISKFSFESLYSKVFSKQVAHTVGKELALGKNKTLSIENIYGNINIKTEWKQNSIILQATKQVSKKENPNDTEININQQDQQKNKNQISIKTVYKNEKTKSPVHYELIVPNNINIILKTTNGDIKVKHLKGNITAQTDKGEIKISQVTGNIAASVTNGNIKISQSTGNIHTKTQYGNITIQDSIQSICAETESGFIKSSCKKIPSTGSVHLATNTGNILLELPKSRDKINSDIKATTQRGKLTSEHFITLKPQTVTLDKHSWARFRREANGTIGSGDSTIKLCSNFGNIKILKANT